MCLVRSGQSPVYDLNVAHSPKYHYRDSQYLEASGHKAGADLESKYNTTLLLFFLLYIHYNLQKKYTIMLK